MNEINFDDWWADLNYEQKRAAFVLWTKSEIKSIYANLDTASTLTIDNTTHSQVVNQWDIKEYTTLPDHR